MTALRPVCADYSPRVFFPDRRDVRAINYAKNLCRRCPLVDPCLRAALDRGEHGVWGATSDDDRKRMKASAA